MTLQESPWQTPKRSCFSLTSCCIFWRKRMWRWYLEAEESPNIRDGSSLLSEWKACGDACPFCVYVFHTSHSSSTDHPWLSTLNPHAPNPWTVARPTGWLIKRVVCCSGTEPGVGTHEFTNMSQSSHHPPPPAKSGHSSGLASQSWWWHQTQSKFLFSSASCDQMQGYRKLQADLWFQLCTWFWLIWPAVQGTLTQGQALDRKVSPPRLVLHERADKTVKGQGFTDAVLPKYICRKAKLYSSVL